MIVDQRSTGSRPQVDLTGAMTLVEQDGKWLVSELDAL